MRLYVGAAFEDLAWAKDLVSWLTAEKHTLTYDWMSPRRPGQNTERQTEAGRRYAAEQELRGIEQADACVFLVPEQRGGAHEIGASLAFRKPTILAARSQSWPSVFCEGNPCFYFHPAVTARIAKEQWEGTGGLVSLICGEVSRVERELATARNQTIWAPIARAADLGSIVDCLSMGPEEV